MNMHTRTDLIAPDLADELAAAAAAGHRPGDPLREPLSEARERSEAWARWWQRRTGERTDADTLLLPTDQGGPPVPVALHRPVAATGEVAPIIYFHGGGYALNSLSTHAGIMRRLADATGRVVLGVGYSRAPERRFPHQRQEALAVLDWLSRSPLSGPDDRAPVLAGDSAGAHLALTVALRMRSIGKPLPSALLLFYPMAFHRFDTPSHAAYGVGGAGLTTERMRYFWQALLPLDGSDASDADLAGANLRGLPPTLVVAAALDCLRDDARRLTTELGAAGVTVESTEVRGAPHAFLGLGPTTRANREAMAATVAFLNDCFRSSPAKPE
jgi:acetyl esterase